MDRLMKKYGGREIQWHRRDGWGVHPPRRDDDDDSRRHPNPIKLDQLFENKCGEKGLDAQGNLICAQVVAARIAARRAAQANLVENLSHAASGTKPEPNKDEDETETETEEDKEGPVLKRPNKDLVVSKETDSSSSCP